MDDTTTTGMTADRRARFEADLAQIRVRSDSSATESRMVAGGAALMAIGVILAIIAFVISGGQADTRDVLSTVILGLIGVSLVVAGGVVFLRYSLSRFLRVWMLRLIYEQQAGQD